MYCTASFCYSVSYANMFLSVSVSGLRILCKKKKDRDLSIIFCLFLSYVVLCVQDAADILSRATLSPLEITASSPPITLSAVPPAASWSVPISVGVDQLRPYTAYLFEVSAFTSDGEGQIASTMVRMPESGVEKGAISLQDFDAKPLFNLCF